MKTSKKVAIAVATLIGIVLLIVGTIYLAGVFFVLSCKKNVLLVKPFSFLQWWHVYQNNPILLKKMKHSLGGSAFLLDLLLPGALILGALSKKRELFGSARFANTTEIRESGLLDGNGIVVGKYQNRYLTVPGENFVLLAAPTRSGKGVSLVIPNLLSFKDSMVVNDIKGECFKLTAGFRKKYGHQVYVFNPFDKNGCTHRYNPLKYVREDKKYRVGDLQSIGSIFYPNSKGDDGESSTGFWNNHARDLFVGLGLYLLETKELPLTLGELLRQSSGKGKPIKQHIQELIIAREKCGNALSDECVHALDRFLSNPDNTLGNIVSTFNAPLGLFADPMIDLATSENDFSFNDLRKQRMTIYVVIPPAKTPVMGVLLNLFYSQLVELNTGELPQDNPELKYQCALLMDEFTVMGRVGIFAKGVAYIAAYNLRLITVIQSMSQLRAPRLYGKEEANVLTGNHHLQILFAPRDNDDSKEFSEWLGTFTEKSESKSRSRATLGQSRTTEGSNVSPQRRPLMLPQELREMGKAKEIIMLVDCKPIQCSKIFYYSDPVFSTRLLPPPEVAPLNFELHQAKVQHRKRVVTDEDVTGGVNLDALTHNFDDIQAPTPPVSQEQIEEYVRGVFGRLSVAEVNAEKADWNHESDSGVRTHNAGNTMKRVVQPASVYVDLAELEM